MLSYSSPSENTQASDRNTHKLVGGYRIRWNAARAAQAYASGLWVRETLVDSLRKAAQETPQRVLIIDGDVRLDCAALYMQAAALAQALLARAPSGSVVSFSLPNWHEAAVIYLGATLAGMVVNPILPSLRDRDLLFILQDVDSRFVFIPSSIRQQDYVAMLARVKGQLATPPEVIVLRGSPGEHTAYDAFVKSVAQHNELPVLDADAVRMILYTSGTTGRPKGVLHTHNSMNALVRQLGNHWLIENGDKFLVPSPIAHIGGSIYAFECPLLLGTTAVLMERWNADKAIRILMEERCTHMAGATPFLEQLLGAADRSRVDLSHFKVFVCGGASVPPSLIGKARAYFQKAVITRVYGLTEVPVATVGTIQRDDAEHAQTTDGRAGIADIKLCSGDSARSADGEICLRGPQMFGGYLHAEDETDVFDEQGFFHTGDLGRWVDGEFLVVTGRAKDIIIRNGENISPKEVEDILIGHPAIAEIAIVGVPDIRAGERMYAVIVSKAPSCPNIAEVRSFLEKQSIAAFKIPDEVIIWETLPKNDAGKVLKHHIRIELSQKN